MLGVTEDAIKHNIHEVALKLIVAHLHLDLRAENPLWVLLEQLDMCAAEGEAVLSAVSAGASTHRGCHGGTP